MAGTPDHDRDPTTRLLAALVDDLRPSPPALPWSRAVAIWTLISGAFVGAAILAGGPLRPGLEAEFTTARGLLELACGAAAIVALIAAGLEIGVPGAPSATRLLRPAAILGASWLGLVLFGELLDGALPGSARSMTGKRAHCFVEALAISLPPAWLALVLLRDRLLWAPGKAGALVGAAAGAMPALGMQLACVADPLHALRFHATPIALTAIAVALVAPLTLHRR